MTKLNSETTFNLVIRSTLGGQLQMETQLLDRVNYSSHEAIDLVFV